MRTTSHRDDLGDVIIEKLRTSTIDTLRAPTVPGNRSDDLEIIRDLPERRNSGQLVPRFCYDRYIPSAERTSRCWCDRKGQNAVTAIASCARNTATETWIVRLRC